MKKLFALALTIAFSCFTAWPVFAQDQPATQQPSAEEVEKQKAEREKNAYRLLEQVIDEAQSLRLTENRVRIQINGADMLWSHNQGRARSLFAMAGEGVAELGRAQAAPVDRRSNRPGQQQNFRSFQLRQELVLAAARHDAALAYQLLAATRPATSTASVASIDQRGPRSPVTAEENLEQALLARIASLDPKLAAQNAEQMMDKGQFPRSLSEVINQLYRQDEAAAQKLAEKTVKRLQSANLLTSSDAVMLAQTFLAPGPRPAASNTDDTSKQQRPQSFGRIPALEQSLYLDLLTSVVDVALKAQPTQNNQRQGNQRRNAPGGARQVSGPQPLNETQIEQNNARRLLAGLMASLPLIDQLLPAKASQLRQKMTEMGMLNNATQNFAQTMNSIQGNPTADALVQAAATAPQQMQSRLYQQAAFRALEEGDTERARQIANDHLQNNARDVVMQRIDFREMTKKAEGARFDEIRQTVARLQTENEKIDLLVQLARDTQASDPKLAVQLLEEARQFTTRRATGYQHFEQQLKVANAFAAVDPARSFEVLEPGINQLNELLAAAAVLSGFEVNMFRDGEMALQGGNGLTNMVNRYGQALALLSRSDFERSEILASRFQFTETRIMARMAIVQGLLGVTRQGFVSRPGIPGIVEIRP